jgi:elongator complex protein 3
VGLRLLFVFMLTPAEQFVTRAFDEGIIDPLKIRELKLQFSVEFGISPLSNVELIAAYRRLVASGKLPLDQNFLKAFRKRGVRSTSGIASITVITKAYPCPGRCLYCPSEPGMPKSYLSNEPAVMRAILNDFDSYKQTLNRLSSLSKSGHSTSKIEVIVAGGTFSFYPHRYQVDFTRGIFNALNSPLPIQRSLKKAQDLNEKAEHRCVGLSFETRPDLITEDELKRLRILGCTKIEIGVQSLNDKVLELNKRDHGIAEVKRAMQLMRDAGYKINCHMMPNLYGSTPENDFRDFVELFENPAYRPDWLKIYPCMVVPWTQLEKIYKEGKFQPYTDEQLGDLMVRIKKIVPEYCRITRLYRDIPSTSVVAGSKLSNLRQIVQERMKKEGIKCRCIRCREIKGEKISADGFSLNVLEYDASGGREFFMSFDDVEKDRLAALLRLRFSSYSLSGRKHFMEELEGAALIREVHTYGEHVDVAGLAGTSAQHTGLGRRLIIKAEDVSRAAGYKKIAVISGIGVREYYRKLGYELEGTYMVKKL